MPNLLNRKKTVSIVTIEIKTSTKNVSVTSDYI